MALLGVVRVQLARRGATSERAAVDGRRDRRRHRRRRSSSIALWARSVDAVVATTLFIDRRARRRPRAAVPRCGAPTPSALIVRRVDAGAVGDGRPVRRRRPACASPPRRGLWVDEAISVDQAQMPFGQMLDDMATTDVHPPLHHAVLWVTVRLFGTSELAVRLPSLLAGVALVPVMYWVGKVALRPAHRLDRGGPRDDRPVLRLVLAGSAHVLAVHAVRGRRRSAPRCWPSGVAAGTTGGSTRCRRRCCSGPSTSASCRSSSSRPAFGWAIWQARRTAARRGDASPRAGR